jgi:SsrA-binding protein
MKTLVQNRKASFEYIFLDVYTAGIKLLGSEVKAIRENNVTISNGHCYFKDGELYVKGMHISEHKESGKYQNHDPLRERKLLLKKKELKKLLAGIEVKGNTIIPISLGLSSTGYVKLQIALAKGKKLHDKKQVLKEKAIDLTEQRESKNRY